MGKNDLKNKVKSASADAARTSLFGSLDDYVSANAAESDTPSSAEAASKPAASGKTPAGKTTESASSAAKTSSAKSKSPARKPASQPVEQTPASADPDPAPAEMDDEALFETYTRKTYFYTQPQIEAIRIMAFNSGLDISQVVRDIMDEAIPDDIMEQAIERVKMGKIKQPRKRRRK